MERSWVRTSSRECTTRSVESSCTIRPAAATALASGRGQVQRTVDAVAGALAAWTIVETLVFSGTVMVWLTFGAAAAMLAIAAAGLILHELSTERVVHSLEDVRTHDRSMEALA